MRYKKTSNPVTVVKRLSREEQAYRIIMQMNAEGKSPYEIKDHLDYNNFYNKNGNDFSIIGVKDYIRNRGEEIKNNEQRPKKYAKPTPAYFKPVRAFRPSVIELAIEALGGVFRDDGEGNYFLWQRGWVQASLTQVMIAANTALASRGEPQIDRNPSWIVKI